MRYVVLVLILLAANRFLPLVTLANEEIAVQIISAEPPIVANTVATPSPPQIELLDLKFALFQPPPDLSLHSMPNFGIPDVLPTVSALSVETEPAVGERKTVDAVVAWEAEQVSRNQDIASIDIAKPALPAALDAEASDPASDLTSVDTGDMRRVTADKLNIRRGPSSRAAVIGTLKIGDRLEVTGGRKGGWVEVATDGDEGAGWVFSRYLEPVEEV